MWVQVSMGRNMYIWVSFDVCNMYIWVSFDVFSGLNWQAREEQADTI